MEMIRLETMLDALDRAVMLCRSAGMEENPWATLVPCTAAFRFSPQPVRPGACYRLSRFALFRRVGNEMVLESPLSPARLVVRDWRVAAVIAILANDVNASELRDAVPGIQIEDVEALLGLMEVAELAGCVNTAGRLDEDEKQELVPWEFHDLAFHARSRSGRHDARVGATFRFRERTGWPPVSGPPVFKDPMRGERLPLYHPPIAEPQSRAPSLTRVLDTRRSIRRFGEQPITAVQVGEFLFYATRVVEPSPPAAWPKRPYPSAGACYELECYLAVGKCAGLPAGLYHYQASEHDLNQLPSAKDDVAELVGDAWHAAGRKDAPQVLVILAARFGRVTVKYESIAYALILKNAGVLMQTMHLVATALGLAGCPIGSGNSDLFARATGLNYYEEGSVGEFLLGSHSEDDVSARERSA